MYQPGKFKTSVNFKNFRTRLSGFELFWDDVSKAPYGYNAAEKLFATFDNQRSLTLKTNYVVDQKLNGIMFWELSQDTYKDGLVDAIYNVKIGK